MSIVRTHTHTRTHVRKDEGIRLLIKLASVPTILYIYTYTVIERHMSSQWPRWVRQHQQRCGFDIHVVRGCTFTCRWLIVYMNRHYNSFDVCLQRVRNRFNLHANTLCVCLCVYISVRQNLYFIMVDPNGCLKLVSTNIYTHTQRLWCIQRVKLSSIVTGHVDYVCDRSTLVSRLAYKVRVGGDEVNKSQHAECGRSTFCTQLANYSNSVRAHAMHMFRRLA